MLINNSNSNTLVGYLLLAVLDRHLMSKQSNNEFID